MELSDEQQYALELFNNKENLFITGPGGVGKTHLIQKFIDSANERNKNVQVCALTGCASLLLGSSAKTIHSWSGIKLAKGSKKTVVEQALNTKGSKKKWKNIDILIIDEVSMMSKKIFEILEEIARIAKKNTKPFGGIQLVLSGDFFQLPPIGNSNEPETCEFCFESDKWESVIPIDNHIELTTMFRQKDPKYIEILSQVRIGQLTIENANILKEHCNKTYDQTSNNNISLTKLFPLKAKVDSINMKMFEKIESENHNYQVECKYDCTTYTESGVNIPSQILSMCRKLSMSQKEYETNSLMLNSPCEAELNLKINTLVMCTINLDLDSGICNGSQGVIVDLIGPDSIPLVKFKNGMQVLIQKHSWQSFDYPTIAVKQYPLKLAYALTVHKIQGATLDMAEIDVGSSVFEYGQTYVAMSRVKSIEGLYLRDFNPNKIKVNEKVIKFYNRIPQIEYID